MADAPPGAQPADHQPADPRQRSRAARDRAAHLAERRRAQRCSSTWRRPRAIRSVSTSRTRSRPSSSSAAPSSRPRRRRPTTPCSSSADAIGIEQNRTFVGLPAVESALLPIGLPEITVYDSEREEGFAKVQTVLTDLKRGGVVARSGSVDSETWARDRTFVVFGTHDSNTEELKEEPR